VSNRVQRIFLTKKYIGDILVTMDIQETLKGLVKKKGLRNVARELGIDHASLYRSMNSDLRLSTIQAILNLFEYDLKIVKRREVKSKKI
jgi:DNA-binding phage protein